MKRYAALTLGFLVLASSSGCCGCLGSMFGHGNNGCCQPCGGGAYGANYMQQSAPACGSCGTGGAYAPSSMSPSAAAAGMYQQASVPFQYQTSALNPNPVF